MGEHVLGTDETPDRNRVGAREAVMLVINSLLESPLGRVDENDRPEQGIRVRPKRNIQTSIPEEHNQPPRPTRARVFDESWPAPVVALRDVPPFACVTQWLECQLDSLKVGGSIPLSGTMRQPGRHFNLCRVTRPRPQSPGYTAFPWI